MTAAVEAVPRTRKPKAPAFVGSPTPRIAPPRPAKSDVPSLVATADGIHLRLMPWQETAGHYLTATNKDGGHLYREVAVVVARQNGKTALLKPLIVKRLRAGRRILHIAQNRELPRAMFGVVADAMSDTPEMFPKRRGKTIWPRYGSGQEEIILTNGGSYRIAASNRGGARGQSIDDLIIDETREMVDWEVVSAAEPTMTMSPDPQTIYLSNAGTDESVVLNSLRTRGLDGSDPSLAYLEWSASPDRAPDDRDGWAEANPALGHFPQVLRELERSYTARKADGQMAIFETERLCRWVTTMREPLVAVDGWAKCAATEPLPAPVRPYMAVSMDPSGKRASAAIAWRLPDETIALRLLFDVPGDPIDTDLLGKDMRDKAKELRAITVGFDPMTDTALTRYFARTESIVGTKYANATARFVAAVEAGKVRWADAAAVTDDLGWTTRKDHDEKGAFEAVRGSDNRPITAVLAAIRAVWLASEPKPRPADRSRTPMGF
jgi:hypothetical protein